jgi:hypothetical protein
VQVPSVGRGEMAASPGQEPLNRLVCFAFTRVCPFVVSSVPVKRSLMLALGYCLSIHRGRPRTLCPFCTCSYARILPHFSTEKIHTDSRTTAWFFLPKMQLRGIDKKIAALKAEVNYASSGDRQRYLSGLSSLEEEKSRLANGILLATGSNDPSAGDYINGAGDSGQDMEDDGGSTPPPSARRRHAVASDNSDDESIEEEYSHAYSSRSRRHADPDTAPATGASSTLSSERFTYSSRRHADIDTAPVAGAATSAVITEKELRLHFHLPLHTAAQKFGVCTTAFKKLCRCACLCACLGCAYKSFQLVLLQAMC